jgi:hypothetical protein
MRFDRDKLEEEVLKKVKEVNEETGYRPYFELPEYVDIVASIIEEQLLEEFAETTLTAWENYLNKISDAILANGKSHETQSNE